MSHSDLIHLRRSLFFNIFTKDEEIVDNKLMIVLPKQENLQVHNHHDHQHQQQHQNGEEIETDNKLSNLSRSYLNMIYAIGEDPMRQGLQKTPLRAAEAFLHFTKGYKETINGIHSLLLLKFVR